MKKKILFQDTSFRDGFQSFFGARVQTDDFIGAVEAAAQAGITHFEAGGGARFQSLFLYCGESAFDMMDRFRQAAGKDANLQTLARGINVVALSQQPKDMIDLHARMFKKHGITHIRNFDALNDMDNLTYSGERIKSAGLHHQAVVTLMELPPGCSGAHDPDFYIQCLRQILDKGVPYDSICFKDASGTSNPHTIYETFKRARQLVGDDVILWHHTHDTAGQGITQYKASIEAGADGVCLARAPVSGGTSQPDLISLWHALKGTNFELDIDIPKILEANAVFKDAMQDYFFPPEALGISSEVVLSPMPGGALTANTMMMRDTGTLHLYPQVIEAMAECVAKGGFGTSVTPVSQFYFQQAYANVTQGKWKKITDGYGNMVLGYFGKTPVAPDPEVVQIAQEQMGKPVFTGDPLEILEPGIPKAEAILKENNLPVTEENVFIVGALATAQGNKGLDFLLGKNTVNVRKKSTEAPAAPATSKAAPTGSSMPGAFRVTVNSKVYDVTVEPGSGAVTSVATAAPPAQAAAPAADAKAVSANLPGKVQRVDVKPGDQVQEGDVLLIIEAMKMENEIRSPYSGTVAAVYKAAGDNVQTGEEMLSIA
ncbi:MAG: biotin/lipoyl-binding protein [Leptospiraceae bacterium]|nr:biotin/lipoyl-binding protein [Leptospiraceae bacterium]